VVWEVKFDEQVEAAFIVLSPVFPIVLAERLATFVSHNRKARAKKKIEAAVDNEQAPNECHDDEVGTVITSPQRAQQNAIGKALAVAAKLKQVGDTSASFWPIINATEGFWKGLSAKAPLALKTNLQKLLVERGLAQCFYHVPLIEASHVAPRTPGPSTSETCLHIQCTVAVQMHWRYGG
jgi:hypothetical protein